MAQAGTSPGPRTEEVRLAMAWNGGVSLAVWMGGAAVELDCARRARIGGLERQSEGRERRVYAGLCAAFDRMLVIDIIAGASAGGLNGALLAGVIRHGRRLDATFLRDKWLEIGDFGKLLRPTNVAKPPSIMQGELFATSVESAFRSVLGTPATDQEREEAKAGEADDIPELDVLLDVQATNVIGIQRGFRDEWGQTLYATEFRTPIRFRSRDDYTAENLATAARASASFPAAFEPHPIAPPTSALGGFPDNTRYAIDGGLLENAPIRPAIELIPTRPAGRPVRRFVCYVNAAPPREQKPEREPPDPPSLRKVLGYVVNLPRDGRFIDQLTAIEDATRRAETASDTEQALISLDLEPLRTVATTLLPAYRRRRALSSLEDIVVVPGRPPDPGRARTIFRRMEEDPRLPWVPQELGPPEVPAEWSWGFRTAQRVLHLELDLLRTAYRTGVAGEQIYAQRGPIEAQLARLDELARTFYGTASIRDAVRELEAADDLEAQLDELDAMFQTEKAQIFRAVRTATESFHGVVMGFENPPLELSPERLFGQSAGAPFTNEAFGQFLQRALALEVIRRAFASDQDIESSQRLFFAQLTPLAACAILTERPFTDPGSWSPERKLTGIRLGHFAAFYRSSWRANDFMWGRLDGAARVVDLLVSAERADEVRDGDGNLALAIASSLLPPGIDAGDHERLVEEALTDAAKQPSLPESVRTAASQPGLQLGQRLAESIAADLAAGGDALFTRTVCARAAQYEVLREELPHLVIQSANDGKLGCFTEPLSFDTTGSLSSAIASLRQDAASEDRWLPKLLGRDLPDEASSNLALRTVSHAALVMLAALPTLGVPLSRVMTPARVPFLAVSGMVAGGSSRLLSIVLPLSVLVSFIGASAFLTAQLSTAKKDGEAPLGALWSASVLALWVAAIAVAAVALVPAWRATRSEDGWRKVTQTLWAVALGVAGGAVAILFALWKLGFAEGATASGGEKPPWYLSTAILLVAAPIALVIRKLPIPDRLKKPIAGLATKADVAGLLTALAATVVAILAAVWAVDPLTDGFRAGGWRTAAVICCAAAVPVGVGYVCLNRWQRRRERASLEAGLGLRS
jgi:predicted acylesterase/phospholipase RssA